MRPIYKNIGRHGFALSGTPVFYGYYEGKKVKLYGVSDQAQVDLRRDVKYLPGGLRLPGVIATEGKFIVQEWIDGTLGTDLKDKDLDRLNKILGEYFAIQFADTVRSENYFYDIKYDVLSFLAKSVQPWLFLRDIRLLHEYWQNVYVRWKDIIPRRVHHCDLQLTNIVLHHESNEFYVIDNEALSFGPSWILDYSVSDLSGKVAAISEQSKKYSEFIGIFWILWDVADKLRRGNANEAIEIVRMRLSELDYGAQGKNRGLS